ncbi:hypothetical protein POTOM_049937 [Populus tomentosa]|uniref:SKP1-like protein 21 n=1 Tax=Populus tomentosa TaxID=118781 RepID=A0A8X8CAX5_POPTO|nr:hypothetical protein POTOM_049937 [Populus tomentosa]
MSEAGMAVVKPQMKSYIWLQTADGSIQQVEEEVAMFCPMICREIMQTGMGSSKNYAISLPQRVNPAILGLILDYCRFHQVPGRSNKERKTFDEKFIRMDTKRLCELTSAADSLQLKPLVDLTSRALARIIEGKTPEEIRETFHLPDDLTEEEKLEPLRNITDDPRIRLLNRLYARKRKELKEREKLKDVEVEEERADDRSVEDLLSFINGADGGFFSRFRLFNYIRAQYMASTNVRVNQYLNSYLLKHLLFLETYQMRYHLQIQRGVEQVRIKRKTGEKKINQKIPPQTIQMKTKRRFQFLSRSSLAHFIASWNCFAVIESDTLPSACPDDEVSDILAASPSRTSNSQDFDDAGIDDDLDPAKMEELDREVEDFARRLNSDWPERMQEILSLGPERRLVSMNVNGSSRRYSGHFFFSFSFLLGIRMCNLAAWSVEVVWDAQVC